MSTRPFTSVWSDLAQVEFSQGFLQAGPYRTRYLHAGDESKPVLLMLHGITGHAEAYVRNLKPTASTSLSRPSTSSAMATPANPTTPWRSSTTSTRSCHVLDALGAEKAYFTGESLGGWIDGTLAQHHPERVQRIVLNTMGGTMANPKVMERLYTLSDGGGEGPELGAGQGPPGVADGRPGDGHRRPDPTRQAIFQQPDWLMACETNMALQDPETRNRNMLTRRRPAVHRRRRRWCCGRPRTPPARSTRPSGSPP